MASADSASRETKKLEERVQELEKLVFTLNEHYNQLADLFNRFTALLVKEE